MHLLFGATFLRQLKVFSGKHYLEFLICLYGKRMEKYIKLAYIMY